MWEPTTLDEVGWPWSGSSTWTSVRGRGCGTRSRHRGQDDLGLVRERNRLAVDLQHGGTVDHCPERLEPLAFDAMDTSALMEIDRRTVPGIEVTPSLVIDEEVVRFGSAGRHKLPRQPQASGTITQDSRIVSVISQTMREPSVTKKGSRAVNVCASPVSRSVIVTERPGLGGVCA